VVLSTIPADADWSNWTSDPSYLIVMQSLVGYLSGDRGDRGLLRVAQPIRQPLNLTDYEIDASLVGPRERKANIQATAAEKEKEGEQTVWNLEYPNTEAQGFYEVKLIRRNASPETVLFAANVDPAEGDLKRVDQTQLKKNLGDKVEIITVAKLGALDSTGTSSELWWLLLWGVVALLCSEQLLAWWFGRGR
jgi:hypothetical protein